MLHLAPHVSASKRFDADKTLQAGGFISPAVRGHRGSPRPGATRGGAAVDARIYHIFHLRYQI